MTAWRARACLVLSVSVLALFWSHTLASATVDHRVLLASRVSPVWVTETLNAITVLPVPEAAQTADALEPVSREAAGEGKHAAHLLKAVALERAGDVPGARASYTALVAEARGTFYATTTHFRLRRLEALAIPPTERETLYQTLAQEPIAEGWFLLSGQWTWSTMRRAAWQGLVELRADHLSFRLFTFLRAHSVFPLPYAYLFILLVLGLGLKLLELPLYVQMVLSWRQQRSRRLQQVQEPGPSQRASQLPPAQPAARSRAAGVSAWSGRLVLLVDLLFASWLMVALHVFAPQLALDGARFWGIPDVLQPDSRGLMVWLGLSVGGALLHATRSQASHGGPLAWATLVCGTVLVVLAWSKQWPAYVSLVGVGLGCLGLSLGRLLRELATLVGWRPRPDAAERGKWLIRTAGGLGGVLAVGGVLSLMEPRDVVEPFRGVVEPLRGELLHTFTGHDGAVISVALSPDGQTLASASGNKIRLWDVQTGRLMHTLAGHIIGVPSVALSPDGQTLASAGLYETVRLWDVQTGTLLRTLTGHNRKVMAVALSPDGQTLASAGDDRTVHLWDVQTGTLLRTLTGHNDGVRAVAFFPDGQTLASAGFDRTVRLWDVQTGTLLRTLTGHNAWVLSVALSPDGQTLASASDDQTVRLWDVQTGTLLRTLTGHNGGVVSVALSPDGQTLASASGDKIRLWDVQTGTLLRTLTGHSDKVWSVALSPDGQTLASGSNDKTVRLWRVPMNATPRPAVTLVQNKPSDEKAEKQQDKQPRNTGEAQPQLAERWQPQQASTVEVLPLRTAPKAGGMIIRQMPAGTLLEVSSAKGDWAFVSVRNERGPTDWGWVQTRSITLQAPDSAPRATAPTSAPSKKARR